MQISTGQPPTDGRYVAFVECESRQIPDWCEPIIATWHGERWHCGRPVYGWIGPLPVRKIKDFAPPDAQWQAQQLKEMLERAEVGMEINRLAPMEYDL